MKIEFSSNTHKQLHPSCEEKRLSLWLLITLALLFGMVVIGGLTRLTGSGLSMVTWKPLTGFIPPMNLADWQALFLEYQTSPEFLKVNFDMTLEEFKNIFWLEFIHRVWGRIIGVAFLIPVLLCLKNKELRKQYGLSIFGIWCLGGLQGVVGWYMVKSGLVHDPEVSHYRLAIHLLLAFLTFSLILWVYLGLQIQKPASSEKEKMPLSFILICITLTFSILTIFYGALVAGLKAGLLYNTFPTMDGAWIPDAFYNTGLNWKSFFEEPGLVQWVHRCLAITTLFLLVTLWIRGKNAFPSLKKALHIMIICGISQLCLGIITLLLQVPVFWGVLHQAGALITLSSLIVVLYLSRTSVVKSLDPGKNFSLQSFQKSSSGKGQTA